MKKRFLTALMAVCLVFALGTVTALADVNVLPPAGADGIIRLTDNVNLAETVTIAAGENVTLDLAGHNIDSGSKNAFVVEGNLTIMDSTATAAPVVSSDYESVTYYSGKITSSVTTIDAENGGTVTLQSGTVESTGNIALYAGGNIKPKSSGDESEIHSSVVVNGGYVVAREFAISAQGRGASLSINNGVLVAQDNAVIGGNGSDDGNSYRGGTTMSITGGTMIGRIFSGGYIACGVYHPQHGQLNISGGTIVAKGGVGVLMRGGSANITGGTIIAESSAGGTTSGKVGDARILIGADGVVYDKQADYRGMADDDSVSISGNVTVQAADSSVEIVKDEGDEDTSKIVVTSGTFLSDGAPDANVETYFPDGAALEVDENGSVVGTSDPVASANGINFTSLQAAIDAAEPGSTVVLLSNVEEHITVPASANIKLDLNGKTIDGGTGNGTATIRNEGTLVIKDSAGGGTIKRSDDGAIPPNSYYVIDNDTGTLTFESGSVYNNSGKGADGSSLIRNIGTATKSATLNINGGTFRQDNFIAIKNDDYGILNVNGGTIISENDQAIQNWNTAEITDGNITGQVITWSYTTVPNNAKMTISGGYIDGPVNSINYYEGDQYATTAPEIIITGDAYVTGSLGTYTHRDGITTPTTDANDELAKITVNGGTFEQPAVKYLADNLNYEVKTGGTPATYTYYPDATTAAANAPMGSTITYLGSTTGVQTYTVTFVYYNGYQTAMTVPGGTEITLPGATRANYTFDGWKYTGGTLDANTKFQVNGNVTFTAVWKDGQYDIVIDDGMKFGDVIASVSSADLNDTVTLYVRPDLGFKLDEIKVTYKSGLTTKTVALTYVRENTYTFKMPAADVLVTATFKADGMPFVDVSRNQWFYDAVYYVWSNGVMEGVSTYYFYPGDTMTRAMFWTVLARIDGESITGPNWVSEARAWAMANGVSDGTDPYGKVTREQMVTMLWRYIGEPNGTASLSGYTDAGTVSGWAEEAMRWAIGRGVINGMTNTTLEPRGDATRAQCATIFMRYMKLA